MASVCARCAGVRVKCVRKQGTTQSAFTDSEMDFRDLDDTSLATGDPEKLDKGFAKFKINSDPTMYEEEDDDVEVGYEEEEDDDDEEDEEDDYPSMNALSLGAKPKWFRKLDKTKKHTNQKSNHQVNRKLVLREDQNSAAPIQKWDDATVELKRRMKSKGKKVKAEGKSKMMKKRHCDY